MASITSILPLEIIGEIIDEVAMIDATELVTRKSNVKACSLTCSTFHPRARMHVFRSINIYDVHQTSESQPSFKAFGVLLANFPEIAGYVQELHCAISPFIVRITSSSQPPLERLKNMKTLKLYAMHGNFQCNWANIDSVLLRLMRLPTITTLQLKGIYDFVPSDLEPCANLEGLHLINTRAHRYASAQRLQSSRSIRLRELTIDETSALRVARFPINLRSLKRLKIIISYHGMHAIAKALESISYLEYMHIIWVNSRPVKTDLGSFQTMLPSTSQFLKTLQTLRIDKYLHKLDSLEGIPQALENLAGANRIETLIFNFDLRFGHAPHRIDSEDWALMEGALLGPGWPSLKNIHLSIFVGGPHKVKLGECVRKRVPRLSRVEKILSNTSLQIEYLELEGEFENDVYI